jgi:hypothetical protein
MTSQKEVTKQKKSRFFLLFLLNDRRIRIQVIDPDPGGTKTCGSGYATLVVDQDLFALRIGY